jgi:prepilin-type N-terminal cleavage/methylation domain-containing protein
MDGRSGHAYGRAQIEDGQLIMSATPRDGGFTLVEIVVAIAVLLIVLAGVGGMYVANGRARTSEDLSQVVETQLRLGMERITYTMRTVGYGNPKTNLASWYTWVSGMSADPLITAGASASDPDTLKVALCTTVPVATLSATAASGATTMTLDSVADLNTTNKRLIYVNDAQSALILSITGNVISIDTDPATGGPQGTARAYTAGTPICRVDVVTYSVDTATQTLREDLNQGAGAQVVIDGITNFKVTSTAAPSGGKAKYQITLTARSSKPDPQSGSYITRSLTSTVSVRN